VSTGTIDNYHDILSGVVLGNLAEKKRPTPAVDFGQNQRVELSILRGYGGMSVGVSVDEHGLDQRPQRILGLAIRVSLMRPKRASS